MLHALSIAHHAGNFWLLDHVLKLSFCICVLPSYSFHFPKVLLSDSFLHGSIHQVCHFWVNLVNSCLTRHVWQILIGECLQLFELS